MKTQLSKNFYAFIIAVMMFTASANAQIVYTDVNPDVILTCCPSAYSLDLNNDGVIDYSISYSRSPANNHSLNCTCTGTVYNVFKTITPFSDNEYYSAKLDSNTAINSNAIWMDTVSGTLYGSYYHCLPHNMSCWYTSWYTSGDWLSGSDGYLALRLHVGSNIFYGWIRIIGGTIIKSYAFNSIPNQPILAGETTCTIPTVNLTQIGSLSFCNGDSVTLTANGTGYQYQWKKNNINITGATLKTYVAKTAGIYKCKVTNSCGNKTSGTRTVTVPCRTTNDNIAETLEHLSVYPNPATNSLTIKFPSDEAGEIQIVNLFGQIVYSENINAEQTQIDVSRFVVGIYVIRWSSGENNETKTFSVTK